MSDSPTPPASEAILAMQQANPELTPEEIAHRIGCSIDDVAEVLEQGESVILELSGSHDWSDPDRCPFCSAELEDGGPGFMAHIDQAENCALEFTHWREGIAGDIEGEWSG